VEIKNGLRNHKLVGLAREIKWTVEKYLEKDNDPTKRVVSLTPPYPAKGDVLFSRVNDAFLLPTGADLSHLRKNSWEAYQQALIFLELGYAVDVIHFENREFIPQKDYEVYFDVGWNMERIAPLVPKHCLKFLHITTAHPFFNNIAELQRLAALQQRRGVSLLPRRQIWRMNRAIESADYATILGNEFAIDTYRFAGKPIERVPSAMPLLYPWPEAKDFAACRKHFLWFAGCGMVHKGLDLLLEAFAAMPEYHLWVCGAVENEKDFVEAYRRELYEKENIHVVGWLDLNNPKLLEIAQKCVALVHPSCSESGASGVIACMHAGLIPVVSRESSVDVTSDFGMVLKQSSIEEIRDAVCSIASSPANTLGEMARRTWERARTEHSPQKFIEEYKRAVLRALAQQGRPRPADVACVTSRPR
jgi:glycosyltransferase involved in cell wall biosynthesis